MSAFVDIVRSLVEMVDTVVTADANSQGRGGADPPARSSLSDFLDSFLSDAFEAGVEVGEGPYLQLNGAVLVAEEVAQDPNVEPSAMEDPPGLRNVEIRRVPLGELVTGVIDEPRLSSAMRVRILPRIGWAFLICAKDAADADVFCSVLDDYLGGVQPSPDELTG